MEYFRQPGNRIQAGFALRAGKLLAQYNSLTPTLPAHERYDATLAVCVLQSLLTNCTELLKAMKTSKKELFTQSITDVPTQFGLRRAFITKNTFPKEVKEVALQDVLVHLRNALSHPTATECPRFPSTGYTTSGDASGPVSAFRFTDSPWVNGKGNISEKALSTDREKVDGTRRDFEKLHSQSGFIALRPRTDGKFEIVHNDQIFLPIFTMELPLPALIELATCLANYLAQPTDAQWDGRTIRQLVA